MKSAPSPAAFIAAMLIAVCATFAPSSAGAVETDAARRIVIAVVEEAIQTFGGKSMGKEERGAKLRSLIDKYADIGLSSQDILGRYWGKTSSTERHELTGLVLDYAVGSWIDHLNDVPSNQRIDVLSADAMTDGRVLVHSQIITPGESVDVDWTVASAASDGRPAITDVSVEGVSVIQTMRGDFTSIIRANAGRLEPLFEALRRKIASYETAKSQ